MWKNGKPVAQCELILEKDKKTPCFKINGHWKTYVSMGCDIINCEIDENVWGYKLAEFINLPAHI